MGGEVTGVSSEGSDDGLRANSSDRMDERAELLSLGAGSASDGAAIGKTGRGIASGVLSCAGAVGAGTTKK